MQDIVNIISFYIDIDDFMVMYDAYNLSFNLRYRYVRPFVSGFEKSVSNYRALYNKLRGIVFAPFEKEYERYSFHIIDWIFASGYVQLLDFYDYDNCTRFGIYSAIYNGHLNIIKYVIPRFMQQDNISLDYCIDIAKLRNHKHILDYLLKIEI